MMQIILPIKNMKLNNKTNSHALQLPTVNEKSIMFYR